MRKHRWLAKPTTSRQWITPLHAAGRASVPLACLLIGAALAAAASEGASWPALQAKYLQVSRNEHAAPVAEWRQVAAWTFDDGQLPEGFRPYQGEWRVEDGKLVAVAGRADDNRTIRIANCEWPAFRLEFDATLRSEPGRDPAQVCDIGIRFNADAQTGGFAGGYALFTAQYGNQATTLYRLNIPLARTEWSPIEPGRRHRIVLEVARPHVRFWVDGRVVLDAWERRGASAADHGDFLAMDPQRVIALSTYDTQMELDNITISVPAEGAEATR